MALLFHGSVGPFDSSQEDWRSYTEYLEQYFAANDVAGAEKQRAILLSACGSSTYQLIRNLVAPNQPKDRTFDELVKFVQDHHQPPPSVIVQRARFNFHSLSSSHGETVSAFVANLKGVSALALQSNPDWIASALYYRVPATSFAAKYCSRYSV